MPTVFAKHLNQEIRAPVDHSGVIQEVVRHVHHPEDLNDPRDASRDPSIERICDKRLSRASRAWPYASSSVTPRPTFPCFLSSGVTGSCPDKTRDRPAVHRRRNWQWTVARQAKRFPRKRAFPARRADGSGEEASYCPGHWRTPMAPSLIFDISCQKDQQST